MECWPKWIEDSDGEPGGIRRQTAVAAVVLASAALFLLPVDKITERAGFWRIREQTVRNEALVYSLFELQNKGRAAILCHESEYPWRNLAYYFSDQPIVLFPSAPSGSKAAGGQGAEPYLFYKSFRKPLELRKGRYVLNNVDLLAWPVSINKPENVRLEENDGFVGQFVLLRRPVAHGEEFSVGGYKFIAVNN
ncbi:MAG: hypothetical protein U5J83_12075 [Bryobacterales bacterium]|nr:hypothetical protein [Bryobacterales bacterium]